MCASSLSRTQVAHQRLVCMHSLCLTFASQQQWSLCSRCILSSLNQGEAKVWPGLDALVLWCFHDVFWVVRVHSKCTTTEHHKLFHCVSKYKLLYLQVGPRFQIPPAFKLYTAIAVHVIIENRNNAHNTTQNDCSMLLPQIVLYTPRILCHLGCISVSSTVYL